MIRFDAVSKQFGRQTALREVSVTVKGGEFLALLGHNGAGKTTMMKLLLGLTRPSSGSISVMGLDPADSSHRDFRRKVGFLPESVLFQREMKGLDVLGFYARLKRVPKESCAELLESVGLKDEAQRRAVKTYSKGMRQRLGLAQALLGEPELLLLDEPTTGLDPELRRSFFMILDRLKARGATIILSSHILSELEKRCDRALIMREGRVAAVGSVEELRNQTKLPVRIRLTAVDGVESIIKQLDSRYPVQRLDDQGLRIECPMDEKLALVSQLTNGQAALRDIEIHPPDLDDIYVHFSGQRERD